LVLNSRAFNVIEYVALLKLIIPVIHCCSCQGWSS
jgi:hypothetical protein